MTTKVTKEEQGYSGARRESSTSFLMNAKSGVRFAERQILLVSLVPWW
jgi:hypothetical protein